MEMSNFRRFGIFYVPVGTFKNAVINQLVKNLVIIRTKMTFHGTSRTTEPGLKAHMPTEEFFH